MKPTSIETSGQAAQTDANRSDSRSGISETGREGSSTSAQVFHSAMDHQAAVRPRHGGIRWELLPEFEPILEKVLAAPVESAHRTPVKTVTRQSVAGRTFYVKRYLHGARALRPLKYFFKASRSRLEWQRARGLRDLEIPTVLHLAHGERWSPHGLLESILITESPLGYAPLSAANDSTAEALQHALGLFLRCLHDAGIWHGDLHPDNLLYSPSAHKIVLLDLDKIQLRSSLSVEERLDNLAMLHLFSPLSASFFEAYGENFQSLADEISRRARMKRRARLMEESARPLPPRHHDAFQQLQIGGMCWLVRRQSLTADLRKLLEAPDLFLSSASAFLKRGRSSTVSRFSDFVIKRHNSGGFIDWMKHAVRPSRARQAYRKAYHLELTGIATAHPIAFAERRTLGLLDRSYLVTEAITAATDVESWRGDRRQLAHRLGELIGNLHDEGFSHRDLKQSNILIDGSGRPHLIDMEGLRYRGYVSDRRAVADLKRLELTALGLTPRAQRTDRLRFLKSYCRIRGRHDWRWWYKQMAISRQWSVLSGWGPSIWFFPEQRDVRSGFGSLFDRLFLTFARNIYSSFMLLGVVFLLVPFQVFLLMRKRITPSEFEERLGLDASGNCGHDLLLHAASAGEVRSLEPLLAEIQSHLPHARVLLSVCSRDGKRMAAVVAKRFLCICRVTYLPWDLAWIVRRWLRRARPRLVGVVETEIWPNFFFTCRELQLPLLIINGRIPPRDFSIYRRACFLFRYPLSCVTCVGAQDETEARRFLAIGAPPGRVKSVGNLKCEITPEAGAGEVIPLLSPTVVAGSTHPGEEELILSVFKNLQREVPELRLVLAPRDIRRARSLCALTRKFGLQPVLRSQSFAARNWRVLVLDTMGELADFYRCATVVLLGGSFRNHGAHNFLEAAVFAKPVIAGRFVSNFSTLVEHFAQAGALLRVNNRDELEANVRLLIQDEEYRHQIGNRALRTLTAQRGAAHRYWELLRENGLGRGWGK